ncbi:MAG: hypothetical protein MUC49_15740 [Raineya sp.]|jgi:hypothetical protein|nr:hypothetical protein [Raineya sp.]
MAAISEIPNKPAQIVSLWNLKESKEKSKIDYYFGHSLTSIINQDEIFKSYSTNVRLSKSIITDSDIIPLTDQFDIMSFGKELFQNTKPLTGEVYDLLLESLYED